MPTTDQISTTRTGATAFVAPDCARPRSADAVRTVADRSSSIRRSTGFSTTGFGIVANGPAFAAWSFTGRKPMPKVDLHPDRWPLHSTS